MTSVHLFIDPHTGEVTEERCRKCIVCRRVKIEDEFHRAVRGNFTAKCKPCYKEYHRLKNEKRCSMPLSENISICVRRANVRSRLRRSHGPDLALEDAVEAWTGKCSNCTHDLTFEWWPRQPNDDLAIIDRVDTSHNQSYHRNFTWLCNACNTEKGGFDLCNQKDIEIAELRRQLAQRRDERAIPYESILMR